MCIRLAVLLFFVLSTQAAAAHRRMLLVFGASWCVPCQTLHNTLRNPLIVETLQATKTQQLDIDIDVDTVSRDLYEIRRVPTLILVDVNEKYEAHVLKRRTGTVTEADLVRFISE